jgi:uncharacterized membrane protein YebE (DUF533 family)
MNTKNLLEQLFSSGLSHGQKNHSGKRSSESLESGISDFISGKGGAALAGGALGLLLGSKSGRKMGGKVLAYGGLAALGTLAYKAYQSHQKQLSNTTHQPGMQPLETLPVSEVEAHCKVILIALIAASKSDGHVDDRERQMIDQEVSKISRDETMKQWFDNELKKPLDPAEIASYATSPAMASEMYLASLLVVDQQNFMEKSYLDELARQLKLAPGLQAELAKQADSAVRQA